MKTAISIEDRVYSVAEAAADYMGLSRSRLYTLAIEEYLRNHSPDILLKLLNEVYGGKNPALDDDIQGAQSKLFAQEDW
jgi:hypothetical protein